MTVQEMKTTIKGIKYLTEKGIKILDWDNGMIELGFEEYDGHYSRNWYSEKQAIAIMLRIPMLEVTD